MSAPAPSVQRRHDLDLMKCVAILMVILYHTRVFPCDILADPSPAVYAGYWFTGLLSVCCPLFFLVNGILLFSRPYDAKAHMRRTLRLLLLYIPASLLRILVLMAIRHEPMTPFEIVHSLIVLRPGWTNTLWFLQSLVCVYFFYPLIRLAFDRERRLFHWFLILTLVMSFGNKLMNEAAVILLPSAFASLPKPDTVQFFSGFNPFAGTYGFSYAYFCLGGWLSLHRERIARFPPCRRRALSLTVLLLSSMGLFALGCLYTVRRDSSWDMVFGGYDTLFTLINVLCVYGLCLDASLSSPLLRSISSNTLWIYLTHDLWSRLLWPYVQNLALLRTIPGALVYGLAILFLSLLPPLLLQKLAALRKKH